MKTEVEIRFEKRHSTRKDTDYEVVIFKFPNGYEIEQYVNTDRKYLITMSCK